MVDLEVVKAWMASAEKGACWEPDMLDAALGIMDALVAEVESLRKENGELALLAGKANFSLHMIRKNAKAKRESSPLPPPPMVSP